MDAEPIKKKLHRYYDMIAGGVCLVRQSAEEQILFVNKEMLKLYQCKTEQEFYQLTKGRFAGAHGGGRLHAARGPHEQPARGG